MADLRGIAVEHRDDGVKEPDHSVGEDSPAHTGKRFKRSNQGSSRVNGNGEQTEQLAAGQKENLLPIVEDYRTQFYGTYRKEAKDYDGEFIEKYDQDLDTTLIFAGLLSAVTTTFITVVHSEFQPDPNEETAALLRVLIYNVNNTALGGNVPIVPQWTGPPRVTVEVQVILVAILSASFLSAFLAMLGKQWLNRYESIDMRGTAIERSQNRKRKLDGIITWYFEDN